MPPFSCSPALSTLAAGLLLLACSSTADNPPGQSMGMGTGAAPSGTGAQPGNGGNGQGGMGAGAGMGPIGGGGNVVNTGGVPQGGSGNVGNTGNTGNVGPGGAATGGSTGNPPFNAGDLPDRNRVQPGQICGRLAWIQCAGENHCCPNPGRTIEQCIDVQVQKCNSEAFLDAVSLNNVSGYDVNAAEVAFSEFERRASQCDSTIAQWSISPQGLRGVTLGTIGTNGNCTPPGTPPDRPTAAAYLVACNDPAQACIPSGLTGLVWNCAPKSGPGGDCFTDLNCVEGSYCNNFGDPPDLTGAPCVARKPDGAACAFPLECASLTCRGGACVPATMETAYCLQ